ncbi:MAG TPA: hypothetical protein VGN81_26940 [Pseudonocardiaceae bacterium]|jgi:hypothetical protein
MKAIVAELADLLRGVADGTPPPTDSELTVVQPPDDRSVGVLAFPGQNIIVADVSVEWVRSWLASDDLGEPFSPPFLGLLSAVTGRVVGNIDTVLVGRAHGRRRGLELAEITDSDHPRVARAKLHRAEVRAWACPGGLLVLGRGVAGRWEAAVEVDAAVRGFGLGRGLFGAALGLLPEGESVWAQVAPGNAASLRALLAAGYRPVGGEVLFEPREELPEADPIEWFGSYLPVEDWQEDDDELEPAEPPAATHAAPEPAPTNPAHAEPAHAEPAHAEPPAESTRAEPVRSEPAEPPAGQLSAGPSRAESAHAGPTRAEVAPEPAAPEPPAIEPPAAEPGTAAESARAESVHAAPVPTGEVPFEPVFVRLPPIDMPVRAPRPVSGERRPIETHASAAELAAAEADAEAELDADEDTELSDRDEHPRGAE